MRVEILGLSGNRALGSRVAERLAAEISRLRVEPVAVRVTLFDDDGPKGGVAIRFAVTVRLPCQPTVRVEHVATTAWVAVEGSFDALRRQLVCDRERRRGRKPRPKKYYVARRLL